MNEVNQELIDLASAATTREDFADLIRACFAQGVGPGHPLKTVFVVEKRGNKKQKAHTVGTFADASEAGKVLQERGPGTYAVRKYVTYRYLDTDRRIVVKTEEKSA